MNSIMAILNSKINNYLINQDNSGKLKIKFLLKVFLSIIIGI